MRHRLCPRIVRLLCLGSCIITVWGCATHSSPAGTSGRHTIAELLRARDPGAPVAPPETPTAEDGQLWATIKARWPEVEQMLADRQAPLRIPPETPGHTQEQTYVFDVRHIALLERYAHDHRLELKDVIYAMCQEFFERRGYVEGRRQHP
jgi:hypothetical protein